MKLDRWESHMEKALCRPLTDKERRVGWARAMSIISQTGCGLKKAAAAAVKAVYSVQSTAPLCARFDFD